MKYISTRGNYREITAAEAIKLGMVPVGGLFVPKEIPFLKAEEINEMVGLNYRQVAERILKLFLTDYSVEEIRDFVEQAYNDKNFDSAQVAPMHALDKMYILELWHGPTAAFKDMALQIMPRFLSGANKKINSGKDTLILVATSGDTGKAALEGFKNVPGIKIICFYPYGGVSKVQELQMSTTDGDNTYVVAVKGNFDDCQNAVKEIFGNSEFKEQMNRRGYELSSANSINWGRLLPQIIYYFTSYSRLVQDKVIKAGEKINFVVPTGNFGNILSAYYAMRMGLPINKLICASNDNKVLTDFFNSGVYDKNRPFKRTVSPSMDILVSSNLERFIYEITGHNDKMITEWMQQLNTIGKFDVGPDIVNNISNILTADFADEEETLATIKRVFEKYNYTLDTHTAVGVKVYEDYREKTGDNTITVIDATASPFKFNTTVLEAIKGKDAVLGKNEFELLEDLSRVSGLDIHPGLLGLDQKPVLHHAVCEQDKIKDEIIKILS